jgi:hypothetical protein
VAVGKRPDHAWVVRGDVAEISTVLNNVIVGAVVVVLGLAAMRVGLMRSGKTR